MTLPKDPKMRREAIKRLAGGIMSSLRNENTLKSTPNYRLSDFLIEKVWAEFDVFSPECDLLEEIERRLMEDPHYVRKGLNDP